LCIKEISEEISGHSAFFFGTRTLNVWKHSKSVPQELENLCSGLAGPGPYHRRAWTLRESIQGFAV
jgi:hypothetical protein